VYPAGSSGLLIRVECVACRQARPPNPRYQWALRLGDHRPTAAELAASEDDPYADLLRQIQSGETG
jgi:hypothetical protein